MEKVEGKQFKHEDKIYWLCGCGNWHNVNTEKCPELQTTHIAMLK